MDNVNATAIKAMHHLASPVEGAFNLMANRIGLVKSKYLARNQYMELLRQELPRLIAKHFPVDANKD